MGRRARRDAEPPERPFRYMHRRDPHSARQADAPAADGERTEPHPPA